VAQFGSEQLAIVSRADEHSSTYANQCRLQLDAQRRSYTALQCALEILRLVDSDPHLVVLSVKRMVLPRGQQFLE